MDTKNIVFKHNVATGAASGLIIDEALDTTDGMH